MNKNIWLALGAVLTGLVIVGVIILFVVGVGSVGAGGLYWLTRDGDSGKVAQVDGDGKLLPFYGPRHPEDLLERELARRLFTCDPAKKTPFRPEELDEQTAAMIADELGIKPKQVVGYRFRFPNPKSALGALGAELEVDVDDEASFAYDEEVQLIGVKAVRVCLDGDDLLQRTALVPKGNSCVNRVDGSPAPQARVVTACETPFGELVTYGDLWGQFSQEWSPSEKLAGTWARCDQDGRRRDAFGGYAGACRPAPKKQQDKDEVVALASTSP